MKWIFGGPENMMNEMMMGMNDMMMMGMPGWGQAWTQ